MLSTAKDLFEHYLEYGLQHPDPFALSSILHPHFTDHDPIRVPLFLNSESRAAQSCSKLAAFLSLQGVDATFHVERLISIDTTAAYRIYGIGTATLTVEGGPTLTALNLARPAIDRGDHPSVHVYVPSNPDATISRVFYLQHGDEAVDLLSEPNQLGARGYILRSQAATKLLNRFGLENTQAIGFEHRLEYSCTGIIIESGGAIKERSGVQRIVM